MGCFCMALRTVIKVYKELERIIGTPGLKISVDTAMKIAKTITTIRLRLPLNDEIIMMLTPEHRSLMPLFDHLGV